MKKHLLIAAAFFGLTAFSASAQSAIQVPNATVTVYGGYNDNVIQAAFPITNTSNEDIDVLVQRTILSEVPGSENVFCWGVCFTPWVSLSPAPITIGAGATSNDFYGDYTPNGNSGITIIRYSFVEEGTTDSVNVTVNYDATSAVASLEKLMESNRPGIELASANPVQNQAQFRYFSPENNSRLVITDVTGRAVQQLNLIQGPGNVTLQTNNLPAGLYFYSLYSGTKLVSSDKLVVQR